MTTVAYLTVDQVVELHAQALTLGGGLDGLRSYHLLASAVSQPEQSAFGEDAYPTIPDKAAAYGFFIAQNQPFLDGNKRTGALALLVFLDVNGYEMVADEDALAQAFENIGASRISRAEFFDWVHAHVQPRTAS